MKRKLWQINIVYADYKFKVLTGSKYYPLVTLIIPKEIWLNSSQKLVQSGTHMEVELFYLHGHT